MKMKSIWINPMFLKVLSVFLAIIAWLYIIVVQNPEINQTFKSIPVTPRSSETLLTKKLIVVDQQKLKMNLTVSSNRRSISLLDTSSFDATIDVNNIDQPGTYTLPINVSVNDNTVSIIDKKPYYLNVVVDQYEEVSKDAEVVTSGEVKSGYTLRSITGSPGKVLLKGPKSDIDNVSRVVVPVNLENQDQYNQTYYKYKLLDKEGNEINDPNIIKAADTVNVTLDIAAYQTLPFSVDLKNPPDASYVVKNLKIEPSSIRVIVPDSMKSSLSSIYLGTFEIKPDARSITIPVVLPPNVVTVDKFNTVTVEYELVGD